MRYQLQRKMGSFHQLKIEHQTLFTTHPNEYDKKLYIRSNSFSQISYNI